MPHLSPPWCASAYGNLPLTSPRLACAPPPLAASPGPCLAALLGRVRYGDRPARLSRLSVRNETQSLAIRRVRACGHTQTH